MAAKDPTYIHQSESEVSEEEDDPEVIDLSDGEKKMIQESASESILQDAQGWPDVEDIELYLNHKDVSPSRKKAVRGLYTSFVNSQEDMDELQSLPKSQLVKVLSVTKAIPTLPKKRGRKIMGIIDKCIELCPDRGKRKTSQERKSNSEPVLPTKSSNAETSEPSSSASSVILGVDVTQNDNSKGEPSKKRKAASPVPQFFVEEIKKKKADEKKVEKATPVITDEEFFSSKMFNGWPIKGHKRIIPRATQATPVSKQLDDWAAVDKDTDIAAFEKTWINQKSTNKQYILRIQRRYKKKGATEGSTYSFDIALENLDIMIDQLNEVKKSFEKQNPGWFEEAEEKRAALLQEINEAEETRMQIID